MKLFVQFWKKRFLIPMLLTFLRNHPYHYLGKKARPELPKVKTTQCVAAPQERAQRATTQELGKPHFCYLVFKLTSVFHREM